MALGAVYIRPQPLALPATDEVTAADVILAFFDSVLKDPEAALPAIVIMGGEAANALHDFVARMEEPLRFADGKIRNVFNPFVEPIQTFVNGLGADLQTTIPAVLQALSKLLDQLSADQVVQVASNLISVFQKDLGISETKLQDLLTDVMSRMIEKLQERVTNGETSDEAVALYDFGVGLDDIRILLTKDLQLPDFDVHLVLDLIRKAWLDLGVDRFVALVRQILDRGDQVLDPLAKILNAIATVNVSVSVRPSNRFMAADAVPLDDTTGHPNDETAWYASWIAGKEVRYSKTALGSHPGSGDPPSGAELYTTFDNPFLAGITYSASLPKETMESIAFHTAWIFPLFEAVFFHGTSIEQGDIVNNLMAILLDLTEFGLIIHTVPGDPSDGGPPPTGGLKRRPLPWWVKGFVWPGVSILGRSLETIPHFFDDYYTPALFLADLAEDLYFRRWTWLAREVLLSVLTLANHDKDQLAALRNQATDPAKRAMVEKYRNANYFDGVCLAAGEIGALLLPLICSYTRREQYGLSSASLVAGQMGFLVLSTFLVYPTFIFLTFLLVRPLLKEPLFQTGDFGHLTRAMLRERMFRPYDFSNTGDKIGSVLLIILGVLLGGLDYFVYLHLFTDNATNGGKLAIDSAGNDVSQSLAGYPSPTQSPYLLPFGSGQQTCVQGNMGIISHHPQGGTGQAYAFDFALDQGTEVLCSRAGIVIDIDDTIPTGQAGSGKPWNHVLIMHLIAVPPGAQPPPGLTAANLLPAVAPPPPAVGPPPGKFADGSTPLPAGITIPPYPAGMGFTVPIHPSAAILPAGWAPPASAPYYTGFAGFPAGTQFAFLIPGQDDVGLGASQGPPPVAGNVLSGGLLSRGTVPIVATFKTYGHGLGAFMTQTVTAPGGNKPLYRSGSKDSAGNDIRKQVLGQFMKQGQVIMLADNTGISLMNHVHVHVNGQALASPSGLGSGAGAAWSIPFVYADVKHNLSHGIFKGIFYGNGTARMFTTYTSGNTRVPPE